MPDFFASYNAFGTINTGLEQIGTNVSAPDVSSTILQNALRDPIAPNQLNNGQLNNQMNYVKGYLQSSNFVTGSTGWQITAAGNVEFNTGTFRGALVANSIDIPDTTTANSFHVDANGNLWLGATTLAASNAKITNAGAATFSNITITGGSISSTPISAIPNNSSTDISLLGFSQNLVFTSASATQINWGSGTIILSNGRSFTISSGNTGTMAAATYIYLDTGVSSTVLQTTTTYSTAMGANKILVATAQNNATGASVVSFGGGQPVLDGGANIVALSITGASIAASTITAGKISVTTLGAIQVNTGALTVSGALTVGTSGTIGSGQSAYNTGTGWWLEYNGGTPRLSIGVGGSTTNNLTFDGTNLVINGYTVVNKGTFGGDGSDGALNVTSGTTTVNLGAAQVVVKNYSTFNISAGATLAFSNPHTGGTMIILKIQSGGFVCAGTLNASGMGAGGGAGAPAGTTDPGIAGTNGTTANKVFDSNNHFGTSGGGGILNTTGVGGTGGTQYSLNTFYRTQSNKILLVSPGSGGGGGGRGRGISGATAPAGGAGGAGGGSVLVECNGAWNFTGTISTAGLAGTAGGNSAVDSGGGGGGGGGAAGDFYGLYNTLTADSGTYTVSGGGGGGAGTGSGASNPTGGSGGAGGGNSTGAGTNGNNALSNGQNGASGGAGAGGTATREKNSSYA